MDVFIYSLNDPRDGACRYVGKTIDPDYRLKMHVYDSAYHSYKGRWIHGLVKNGLRPKMEILEVIKNSDDKDWQCREVFWIDKKRTEGCRLTNLESGGLLGKTHSPETRQKISKGNKGKKRTPEQIAALVIRNTGKVVSEETRKKLSEINTGKTHTEETKLMMSLKMRNRYFSPEHRRKISEALKGRMPSPQCMSACRKASTGRIHSLAERELRSIALKKNRILNPRTISEETKKKISAKLTGTKQTPERRQKTLDVWQRPGYRERMSLVHSVPRPYRRKNKLAA